MRVINPKRMLVVCDVVAQNKIKLIHLTAPPCNRRYCVVRGSVRIRKYIRLFVSIFTPRTEYARGKRRESLFIRAGNADDRHRPLYAPDRYILKPRHRIFLFHGCALHRKGIASTLKMLVGKD